METNYLAEATTYVINPEQLLEHWQGHRRLTRKMIEAFPEDKLFTYSIGGMRPFAALVMEMIDLAGGGIGGIVKGTWTNLDDMPHTKGETPATKQELLQTWDEVTEKLDQQWPQTSTERFQQTDAAFGMYESPIYSSILYFIDNEIHHRGQGYVYLRSLGITPPPFWERD